MTRLSLVDFAAMPYPSDTYPQLHVIDDLHDAVVSHSSRPPLSFLRPVGRGSSSSASSFGNIRSMILPGSRSSSLRALGFSSTEYLATQLAFGNQVGRDLRQRDTLLAAARP